MPLKIQCSSSEAKHMLSDPNHQGSAILYTSLFTRLDRILGWFAGLDRGWTQQDNTLLLGSTGDLASRVLRPGNRFRGGHACSRPLERISGLAAKNWGGFCSLRSLSHSLPGTPPILLSRFPSASPRSSSRPTGAASGSRMLRRSHRGPRRDQLLSTSRKPSSPKRCAWGSTADRVSYRNSFHVSLSPSQRLPRTSNVSSTT